jgi:NAD(P)H dehydrogenase (quinone)
MAVAAILSLTASGAANAVTVGTARDTVHVLVAYYTMSGNTEELANAVAEGARSVPEAIVTLKPVSEVANADLETADAVLIGSPTWWGTVAAPVKQFIDDQHPFLGDRVGGAFATGGGDGAGKELVVLSLLASMLNYGMIVVGPHYEEAGFQFGGFGVAVTTGEDSPGVDDAEKSRGRLLGERVARVATRLKAAE